MVKKQDQDNYIDKLIRIAILIIIIGLTYQLIYPLGGILIWGFILAVIFYPFYKKLNAAIGNHPAIASIFITICVLFIMTTIILYVASDIAQSFNNFAARVSNKEVVFPTPPESIQSIPLVGERIYETWSSASQNLENEISKYTGFLLAAAKYGLTKFLHASKDFLLLIIAILFSGYLMIYAKNFMTMAKQFAHRVAPESGLLIINMILETIQNVTRGVIGISMLQAIIFWVLLLIANTPSAGLLSVLALVISIAQIGLIILVIPVIIWLFLTKSFVLAVIISIFLILDALLDSFLKPVIMARGLSTPAIIIFFGVIGGLLAYGMMGVFIGPVVLAITYDLFCQWIATDKPAPAE